MRRILRFSAFLSVLALLAAPMVDARGGGGGRAGGARGGSRGGARGRSRAGKGKKSDLIQEQEDRALLIADRRQRLIDGDRASIVEGRLAAARIAAAADRAGGDVR